MFGISRTSLNRGKQIKDMNRENKLEMIKKFNPVLKDLYSDIMDGTNFKVSNSKDTGLTPSGASARKVKKTSMKNWNILSTLPVSPSGFRTNKLIELLLENRGITSKKDKENFLNPKLEEVTPEFVGIDAKHLKKAVGRIKQAVKDKEQIVVYGDYDVDGITGTAILWETLHKMRASVVPYIPHRIDEGYGLSKIGISNIKLQISNVKLIITVDNGIVAKEAVAFAKEQGIEVIITDHHTIDKEIPDAYAVVHTTKLCGAGVAWLLSKELKADDSRQSTGSRMNSGMTALEDEDIHLELATLGTVADLVPLTGANRAIVKHGLTTLCRTRRPGLKALYKQAGLDKDVYGVYEIGYIIGPRLNAAGRIESAMDSLRLICTKDPARADMLAEKLETTNKERQMILKQTTEHAVSGIMKQEASIKKLLIIAHEEYKEGVIGLVAGRLVEKFYRPSIVISKGEKHSKASARSISGFNIIEFLRSQPDYFVNVGGHPMAAGFTIETEKLLLFQKHLEELAEQLLDDAVLTRFLTIDCELPFSAINRTMYNEIQALAPFGMGNPEPVFATKDVTVVDKRILGREANHLKLFVRQGNTSFEAIAFGMAEQAEDIHIGSTIDLAYVIDENTWNGTTKMQLKVKDIKTT